MILAPLRVSSWERGPSGKMFRRGGVEGGERVRIGLEGGDWVGEGGGEERWGGGGGVGGREREGACGGVFRGGEGRTRGEGVSRGS